MVLFRGSLDSDPHDHLTWFVNLLSRGLASNYSNNPQLQLAAMLALNHADPMKARSIEQASPDIDALTMRELSLIAQLSLAIGAENVLPTAAIEKAFMLKFTEDPVIVNDASGAAALMYLCGRIRDKLLLHSTFENSLDTVLSLCRRFHLFAVQLGHRHNGRPSLPIQDEYDVQDLFHAILLLHFDDVRREEVTPSYAGSSSRVDFYLPDARLIVEVKMTRKSLQQHKVTNQLIEDAARYATVEHVDTLVCLVYDPSNYCHNPTALERDVAESGRRLSVHAVVCPRGM